MLITAETPTTGITIAKHTFQVFKPYAIGHALTEHEASAMNQLFSENIRNNFAPKVKEHSEAGTLEPEALQAALNEYQASYEFGLRRGRPAGVQGPRKSADPVGARAMELAREAVRKRIRDLGGNLKDYTGKEISERARKAVESNPKFHSIAARQIEDEKDIDVGELDSATVEGEASVKRSRKAAA